MPKLERVSNTPVTDTTSTPTADGINGVPTANPKQAQTQSAIGKFFSRFKTGGSTSVKTEPGEEKAPGPVPQTTSVNTEPADDEKAPPPPPPPQPVRRRDVRRPAQPHAIQLSDQVGRMIGAREQTAWESWRTQPHAGAVQKIIDSGVSLQQHFFRYEDHQQRIVPRFEHDHIVVPVVQQRGRRRDRRSVHEIAYLRRHPHHQILNTSHRAFVRNDEFARINSESEQARIGEFCKVDIAPRTLYITIHKGIQRTALQILSKRIHEHTQTGTTRILLKRNKKGTYTYAVWLTSAVLKDITQSDLFQRFLDVTNNGTRAATLVVKQNIVKGHIQELWKNKHSLL
jgi:hypothetical protein